MLLQREACPKYDVEVLYDTLLTHARTEGSKVAFSFGVYDAVQISHAIRGSALLRCAGVMKALLAAVPQGMVRYSDLQMCLKSVATQMPELQHGRWRNASADEWGGAIAERCMVLLAHLRRLRRSSTRLAQCTSKLTLPEQDELASLLARLQLARSPLDRTMSMTSGTGAAADRDDASDHGVRCRRLDASSGGERRRLPSPMSTGPPRDTNLMTQTPPVRSTIFASMLS